MRKEKSMSRKITIIEYNPEYIVLKLTNVPPGIVVDGGSNRFSMKDTMKII